MEVIRSLGSARTRLYRRRRSHPLSQKFVELFREEENRFDAIVGKVREAAEACGPSIIAVWIFGSVARGDDGPGSDLDIALVAAPKMASMVEDQIRETLSDAEQNLLFHASVVALDKDDLVLLAAQHDPLWVALRKGAMTILGDSPEILLMRLARSNREATTT